MLPPAHETEDTEVWPKFRIRVFGRGPVGQLRTYYTVLAPFFFLGPLSLSPPCVLLRLWPDQGDSFTPKARRTVELFSTAPELKPPTAMYY